MHGQAHTVRSAPLATANVLSATVSVRPAGIDDLPAIHDYFDALDDHGRRLRFHGTTNVVPRAVLDVFRNADQRRRITRVVRPDDGSPTVLGEAMLVASAGSASAELALSVAPGYRRSGLGARLLDSLLGEAARQDLRSIHADVLAENAAFIGLATTQGFEWRRHPQDGSLVRMIRRVERCRGAGRGARHRIAGRIG